MERLYSAMRVTRAVLHCPAAAAHAAVSAAVRCSALEGSVSCTCAPGTRRLQGGWGSHWDHLPVAED